MKRAIVVTSLLSALATVGVAQTNAITIDHNGVDVSTIPADSIASAASLRVLLRHASVGQGIGWGLDCLAGLKSNQTACKCFSAGTYDRNKWTLEARLGNGKTKIDDLVTQAETRADQFDVFMMKYCYIDALGDGHPDWEYYRGRMEQLETQYPSKRFVWWTIPLTRDGQPGTDVFNALVRSYCATHGKILFDIADIECHEPDGVKLTNAQGNEVISQRYTQEIHAGHLNVEGRIRVASALWHLMVAIAEDLQGPAAPRVIYVDDDAAGTNDGSSWENAYPYLQDALSDANSVVGPVEIRVAQGTYRPDRSSNHPQGNGDRTMSFRLITGVTVKGGYAGIASPTADTRNVHLYRTILSGDLKGDDSPDSAAHRSDNSYHVVTAVDVDERAVLDGVTVTAGHADGWPEDVNAPPLASSSDPSPRRRDETVDGAGLYIDHANPAVTNCVLVGNYAHREGGALYSLCGHPLLSNCCLQGNWASSGGAIFDKEGGITLVNCTLVGNRTGEVAAIEYDRPYETEGAIHLLNCILWNPPGEMPSGNSPSIGAARHSRASATVVVEYSDILGGWPGDGNLDGDPCFAEPGYWDANGTADDPSDDAWVEGDCHLRSQAGRWEPLTQSWATDDVTSLCIDAGDPNSPVGEEPLPNGGRVNMGAYGGTAEASKSSPGG